VPENFFSVIKKSVFAQLLNAQTDVNLMLIQYYFRVTKNQSID